MTKINILVGMTLLVLAAANGQDNTIISMQSDVHCENDSIPEEYLHQSLYACADANFLPSTSTIMFSIEDLITPVNQMSMSLDSVAPNGCFSYVPKHKQFKICFNLSSSNTIKFHPNDRPQIFITRAIYFGKIENSNKFEDDIVWPIIYPVDNYHQSDLRFTQTYSALQNEKVLISYVIEEQRDYIVKLTIEEEKPNSININMKKWKQNTDKYLMNTDLRLSKSGQRIEYVAEKDVNFRVYFYTFALNEIEWPKKLNIMAKVTFGDPPRGDSHYNII